MAKFTDSGQLDGIGIVILRHNAFRKKGYTLQMRPCILGVAIDDYDTTKKGSPPKYIYRPENVGDILGALLWPADFKKRPMSAWHWAWPSILPGPKPKAPGGGSASARWSQKPDDEDGDGKSASSVFPMSTVTVTNSDPKKKNKKSILPTPDLRFRPLKPIIVKTDPDQKFPPSTPGITLALPVEDEQREVFFPLGGGGNTLIAVDDAGDRDMGTLVYDTTAEYELNQQRKARLQSMFWVLPLISDLKVSMDIGAEPFLGWNIYQEQGYRDKLVIGGAIVDFPPPAEIPTSGRKRVVGFVSHKHHGPLIAGALKDKHQIGVIDKGDPDGLDKPTNSAHISTNAYFLMAGEETADQGKDCHKKLDPPGTEPLDGPLDFEGPIPDEKLNAMKEYDNPTQCHLELWERNPPVDFGSTEGTGGEEVKLIQPGDCIEHQFFEKKRAGKWRLRSSCVGSESEADPSGKGS